MTQLLSSILEIEGQKITSITHDKNTQSIHVYCQRDKRFKIKPPHEGQSCTVNTYCTRTIRDLAISGQQCFIHIELAQVRTQDGKRSIEASSFVKKGVRYSNRLCHQISGYCRHMSISAVAKHFNINWETVRDIDKYSLTPSLPALDPTTLTGLKHIGVDEVARAKGHDYMTVVYNMDNGQLIWVEHGRTSKVLSTFLKQLPQTTALGIQAVAMDMGKAYQHAVKSCLPNADIVFDRFHVMKNFSKIIKRVRLSEFRKAGSHEEKGLIKGSLYLLLMNAKNLKGKQSIKLNDLLHANKKLCTLYMMKEQLQALWLATSVNDMNEKLDAWCELANSSGLFALQDFAKSLREHRVGICNYAKYGLTSARIEAGNVSIGLIRRRARGIRDTEYFKLKIRQISVKETFSIIYPKIKLN